MKKNDYPFKRVISGNEVVVESAVEVLKVGDEGNVENNFNDAEKTTFGCEEYNDGQRYAAIDENI